jgi:Helicase HerA, central domain
MARSAVTKKSMQDFEKLGAFYLGKRFDTRNDALSDELTLYDSKDLTTHAVIIGMTGSGKTGLGIGLIEEAAIDHVPVIAIDPKGDLGNLLLTFPKLEPADFEPWIDPASALEAGRSLEDQAAATAALWRNGLAQWGQDQTRIEKLRSSAEFALFTPGSTASMPVSVLKTLSARAELVADADAFRDHVQSTVQSLLTLLDIDADPLTSREHILLSNILSDAWARGESLDLPHLILAVQTPPMSRIGVMDIESFYPSKDRFALAMRINNLLAAPGFEVWTQGAPLDIQQLLYTAEGKPRVCVMSIAHLSDPERMFFVTALLGELVSWMRAQPGSASLRAILYMDEVFGYLPPVANPPSKPLFLTLLKQARAYGVGLVLATQNPVDLDYKALSNIGTWMIGRLQTTRDVDRVRAGLESASGSESLELATLDATLAGLGKRSFLLHNVHDKAPTIFQTRWVMSYLAGPLTAEQIKRLAPQPDQAARPRSVPSTASTSRQTVEATAVGTVAPLLDPAITQVFLPITSVRSVSDDLTYVARLVAVVRAKFERANPPVAAERTALFEIPVDDGPAAIDWDAARELELELDDLGREPAPEARFAACPNTLTDPRRMAGLDSQFKRWFRSSHPLPIFKSPTFKTYSNVDETEGEFRVRLQTIGNQERDRKIGALKQKYEKQLGRLHERLLRAQQALERESGQARTQRLDAALSFGTAVLGALLGRKALSTTSATRVGTAIRKAGRSSQQSADVRHAEQRMAAVQEKIAELEAKFDADIDALDAAYDAQAEELVRVEIRPKLSDIEVPLVAVGWVPRLRNDGGSTHRA